MRETERERETDRQTDRKYEREKVREKESREREVDWTIDRLLFSKVSPLFQLHGVNRAS